MYDFTTVERCKTKQGHVVTGSFFLRKIKNHILSRYRFQRVKPLAASLLLCPASGQSASESSLSQSCPVHLESCAPYGLRTVAPDQDIADTLIPHTPPANFLRCDLRKTVNEHQETYKNLVYWCRFLEPVMEVSSMVRDGKESRQGHSSTNPAVM